MKKFLTSIILVVSSLFVLLIGVNVLVDSANILRSDEITNDIMYLLSNDNNVIVPNNYNDRDLAFKTVTQNDSSVDTVVLGSSRGIQISSDMLSLSDDDMINSCVTGAVLGDVVSLWQSYLDSGNLPKRVILVTDIWFFDQRKDDDRYLLAYGESYQKFLSNNVQAEIAVPQINSLDSYSPLYTLAYFQQNIKSFFDGSYLTNKVISTQNYAEPERAVIHPDGSYSYPINYTEAPQSEKDERVRIGLPTISSEVGGYEQLYDVNVLIFEALLKSMEQNGVEVVLYLSPYHPDLVSEFESNDLTFQMFFETEQYLLSLEQNGIQLIGSYDHKKCGVSREHFLDPLHINEQATRDMVQPLKR